MSEDPYSDDDESNRLTSESDSDRSDDGQPAQLQAPANPVVSILKKQKTLAPKLSDVTSDFKQEEAMHKSEYLEV